MTNVDPGAAEARATPSTIIAMVNQKGGVGKTMLSLSLAQITAASHGRALIVDVDPQSNAHDLTTVMDDPGYDVVHETDPHALARIRELREYDTLFVDCPGSLEGQAVLDAVLTYADFVLIPYDHEPESVMPTLNTIRYVQDRGTPYAVVVTKVLTVRGAAMVQEAWATVQQIGGTHFRTFVRSYRAWPNSLRDGVPITRYRDRGASSIRQDVAAVHTELLLNLRRRPAVAR